MRSTGNTSPSAEHSISDVVRTHRARCSGAAAEPLLSDVNVTHSAIELAPITPVSSRHYV